MSRVSAPAANDDGPPDAGTCTKERTRDDLGIAGVRGSVALGGIDDAVAPRQIKCPAVRLMEVDVFHPEVLRGGDARVGAVGDDVDAEIRGVPELLDHGWRLR